MVNSRRGQGGLVAVVRIVRVVRLAALGVVAAVSAGCTEEACFNWTPEEGACPSQEEALQFFVPVGCTGEIESVDSEGEYVVDNEDAFSGDLCCYEVTRSDNEFAFCNQPPF